MNADRDWIVPPDDRPDYDPAIDRTVSAADYLAAVADCGPGGPLHSDGKTGRRARSRITKSWIDP